MILYPTIEILNGKCVSLRGGRIDQPEIWHVDPVQKAVEFAQAGAEWMQVTDFNALDGDDGNQQLVEDIIRAAGIPVQLAGGFRSMERIEASLDKGAGRIVIATAAVNNPELVREAAKFYPDQIAVSVDVYNGKIVTEGWRTQTMFTASAFVENFKGVPLAGIIYTDVNADSEEMEVTTSEIARLAQETKLPVIASGMVRALDDLSMLKYAGRISGAIIGRALFNQTIDLQEALAVAQPQPEENAAFI